MSVPRQPWIHSARVDLGFILLPPVLATLAVAWLAWTGRDIDRIPDWAWLGLIVGVDVAHVWATMYRTYFDRREWRRRPVLFAAIPAGCLAGGIALYAAGPAVFWRVLAYLAVFHFVRQQYGFLRIYSRGDPGPRWIGRWVDAPAVYLAAVYPIVHWHAHLPRNFHWFMEGDFLAAPVGVLLPVLRFAWGAWLTVWGARELVAWRLGQLNVPRVLLVGATAASWYTGIVWLDGDLAFTATNVIAHGIPYLALVWTYWSRSASSARSARGWRRPVAVAVFVGSVLVLGYLEEGLWDGMIWREHPGLFRPFQWLPEAGPVLAGILVPLLAVPQATHYVLDAFIWRLRKGDTGWVSGTLRNPGRSG